MKKVYLILALFIFIFQTGCIKPYDVPELHTIEPSQTAFLIPLDGKTSDQASFMSEEFLKNARVATKRVQIPHRFLQTGRMPSEGKWIPTVKLIIVERKPAVREWTAAPDTGTSAKNEGIKAESKESISFMAGMSASAQVDQDDAVLFLYRYNNKPLEEIMDTQIRPMVETTFVEECANLTLAEIITNKGKIMKAVREKVIPFFKKQGITVTVLGYKGDFTYDTKIQDAINKKFTAQKELEAQRAENNKKIEAQQAENTTKIEAAQAESKAAAIRKQSGSVDYQLKQQQMELERKKLTIQEKAIEKWDGKLPLLSGSGSGTTAPVISVPINMGK